MRPLFGTLKGIFFVKYTTMLYHWQLVKNKVIQSNFPGNFHDKISLRISLLQEELKNVVIYKYKCSILMILFFAVKHKFCQKYFFQVIDDYENITGRCVL
jgi:hypothetical protein